MGAQPLPANQRPSFGAMNLSNSASVAMPTRTSSTPWTRIVWVGDVIRDPVLTRSQLF